MKTSIHLHHIKANPFIFYFLYTDLNVHFYHNQGSAAPAGGGIFAGLLWPGRTSRPGWTGFRATWSRGRSQLKPAWNSVTFHVRNDLRQEKSPENSVRFFKSPRWGFGFPVLNPHGGHRILLQCHKFCSSPGKSEPALQISVQVLPSLSTAILGAH